MKALAIALCLAAFLYTLSPLTLFLQAEAKPGYLIVKTSPPNAQVSLRAHMGGRQHQAKDLLGKGWEPIPIDRLPLDSPSRSLTFLINQEGFKQRELTISGDDQLQQIAKQGVVPLDATVLALEEETGSYLRLKLQQRWWALALGVISAAAWLALRHREQTQLQKLAKLPDLQASDVAHPFLGIDIGEYQVTEYLGCGGMADVYKAVPRHLLTSEKRALHEVVVKFCKDVDPSRAEKIHQELAIAQKIQHPNVVKIYEEGGLPTASGNIVPYLVMEYIPGRTLWELGTTGGKLQPSLGWTELMDYLEPVADALQNAHNLGVVHCDVTPNNVMVTPDGAVKVLDFGLSRALDQKSSAATTMTVGTPYYLSPEQYHRQNLDGRTDQFALAAILYQFLTGASPYGSEDREVQQNLEHKEITLSLLTKNLECPPEAKDVIAKMLATAPSDRYTSIAEAFARLKSANAKSC